MDAKRWFCLVLLTSLLAGCVQATPTPRPTLTPKPKNPLGEDVFRIALDSSGRIYSGWMRIFRLDDMSGAGMTFYSWIGVSGLNDVAVDASGRIYAADCSNDQIVRMDDMEGNNWVAYGTEGSGTGQWNQVGGIALDDSGRIYVTDWTNSRVVRIDDMTGSNWISYGSTGSGVGQFRGPEGIALDSSGRIYVADPENNRIVRFDDMTGKNWISLDTSSVGIGTSAWAREVFVDAAGRIYIVAMMICCVVRFDDMTGANWIKLGSSCGLGKGQFGLPGGVAVDSAGRIYVSDAGDSKGRNGRIVRVDDMNGTNWTTFP